jgi:hypothetical protein
MISWLNINTVQGLLRTLLAFGGGILVGKGRITTDQLNTLTAQLTDPAFLGSCAAVITAVWSVIHKQATPAVTVTSTTTATAVPAAK